MNFIVCSGKLLISSVVIVSPTLRFDNAVGDKTLIEVTAPSDVTNPVLVDVDGVGYYVNITNGKGSIEVPISKEGTYNVTATKTGYNEYTGTITVNEETTSLIISMTEE